MCLRRWQGNTGQSTGTQCAPTARQAGASRTRKGPLSRASGDAPFYSAWLHCMLPVICKHFLSHLHLAWTDDKHALSSNQAAACMEWSPTQSIHTMQNNPLCQYVHLLELGHSQFERQRGIEDASSHAITQQHNILRDQYHVRKLTTYDHVIHMTRQ
jgi:hypothetical protein